MFRMLGAEEEQDHHDTASGAVSAAQPNDVPEVLPRRTAVSLDDSLHIENSEGIRSRRTQFSQKEFDSNSTIRALRAAAVPSSTSFSEADLMDSGLSRGQDALDYPDVARGFFDALGVESDADLDTETEAGSDTDIGYTNQKKESSVEYEGLDSFAGDSIRAVSNRHDSSRKSRSDNQTRSKSRVLFQEPLEATSSWPESIALSEEFLLSQVQELKMQLTELQEIKQSMQAAIPSESEFPRSADNPESQASIAGRRRGRMVVVSYRLPLSVSVSKTKILKMYVTAAGGLASAFREVRSSMVLRWIGVTGGPAGGTIGDDAELQATICNRLNAQRAAFIPLFARSILIADHLSFCNGVLWPLLHHMPLNVDGARSYRPSLFAAYRRVNELFAEAVFRELQDGQLDDIVWIHDFQLLLVPQMVRLRAPHSRIGLFVHTPFPTGEIYRTLPARREILEGMLGADMIGFHTVHYARHFISVCQRVLGLDVQPNGVRYRDSFIRVGVYPMGINAVAFTKATRSLPVLKSKEVLREQFGGKKVVVGVDRIDYIKGLPHKLMAIERFLELHPEWLERVVFVQVCIPSTSVGDEYSRFRSEILQMVGRINGRFSTLEHIPIHYRETSLSFDELCALYSVSDVLLSTSLRDGMNLVSYEFSICQQENRGPVVLSEFTGAAHSLPGALLCNPWNIDEVVAQVLHALNMPEGERELRHRNIFRYVLTHSSSTWALNFVSDLKRFSSLRQSQVRKVRALQTKELVSLYSQSRRCRLIILEYNATSSAQVGWRSTGFRFDQIVRKLSADSLNLIFILTPGDSARTVSWLYSLGAGICCEHGYLIKWPSRIWPRVSSVEDSEDNQSSEEQKRSSSDFERKFYAPKTRKTGALISNEEEHDSVVYQNSALKTEPEDLIENNASESSSSSSNDPASEKPNLGMQRIGARKSKFGNDLELHIDILSEDKEVRGAPEKSSIVAPGRAVSDAMKMKYVPNLLTQSGPEEVPWEHLGVDDESQILALLPDAITILEQLEEMTPGSSLVVNRTSASWSYGESDPEYAYSHASDARHLLEQTLSGSPLEVISAPGHVLVVRPRGVNTGAAFEYIIERLKHAGLDPDFIAVFGDELTNEKLFGAVDALRTSGEVNSISCAIGHKSCNTEFSAETIDDVLDALQSVV